MNFNDLRKYINQKPEVEECFPFGSNVYVYKLKGKMFALIMKYQGRDIITFKLDPEEGLFLRDLYKDFIAGYHFNKKHWNSIFLEGDVPNGEIEISVDKSYGLVFDKLTKKNKNYLLSRYSINDIYNKK